VPLYVFLLNSMPEHVRCNLPKAYIGMLIIMRILQLPYLDMYWQVDDKILGTPGISELIAETGFNRSVASSILLIILNNIQQVMQGMINFSRYENCWI